MVNPAIIMKGIQIAGQVKDTADTINTASKIAGVNQDSIFAQKEQEGNGGAINSIFQAADTLTGGAVGQTYEAVDESTGGVASKVVDGVDNIVTPVLEMADMANGPDADDVLKRGNKLPDMQG